MKQFEESVPRAKQGIVNVRNWTARGALQLSHSSLTYHSWSDCSLAFSFIFFSLWFLFSLSLHFACIVVAREKKNWYVPTPQKSSRARHYIALLPFHLQF